MGDSLFNPVNPSGTYDFLPSHAEVIASAFSRIQIKRTELEQNHIQDGIAELNFFLASFNNAGPNLAQVDLIYINLFQGIATYQIPPNTVQVLDVFMNYSPGSDEQSYLFPISRTEYAAIPNKTVPGRPNQYWYWRLQQPQLTLYPVPDADQTYTLNIFCYRQVQDATFAGGTTPEIPNRGIDALVSGLAYRLARIYKPELEQQRKADAAEAWAIYAKQDTENVDLYIVPALQAYWRI